MPADSNAEILEALYSIIIAFMCNYYHLHISARNFSEQAIHTQISNLEYPVISNC